MKVTVSGKRWDFDLILVPKSASMSRKMKVKMLVELER